jgi:hypothetical protein
MMVRHSLFRLVLGSALVIGAGSVAEAAMSVKDFMRPAAATPAEGAAAGLGSSMTLQEFLRLSEQKEDDPGLVRYFDGFRDALYQFNNVLQGVGVQVFCPADGEPPIATAELRRRLEADLSEKRAKERDFDAYVRSTSVGLVALVRSWRLSIPARATTSRMGRKARRSSRAAAQP